MSQPPSNLQPIDLADFTGGFVSRRSQFTLGDNESPSMLNIEVDPRAGFYTRKGWQRWNPADPVDPSLWGPRHAVKHTLADGTFEVYVANVQPSVTDGEVWAAGPDAIFDDLGITASAVPHIADFAPWGDEMYIACGYTRDTQRRSGHGAVASLTDASTAYNDDYTNPIGGTVPRARFLEPHAGYMFAAYVAESGTAFPNRVRWSHPDDPEDWTSLDFLDIERGGGRITGLLSFRDHLLIFKTDSIWALYGYDLESWQLIEISTSVGVPSPTCFCRSENAVYFFSASDRNGIYAYTGQSPIHLSEKIRNVVEQVVDYDSVHAGWLGRRLWVSMPVQFSRSVGNVAGLPPETAVYANTVLVFDPEVADGSWVRFTPGAGTMGPMVHRSDVDASYPLATLLGDSGAAAVVRVDFRSDAFDVIWADYALDIVDPDGNRMIDPDGNVIVDGLSLPGHPFDCFYRTGWKHAGWPERRKSWLRPRYVNRVPPQTVAVRANAFRDYDEGRPYRSMARVFTAQGAAFWTPGGSVDPSGVGFDWGDGTLWGDAEEGGQINRVPRSLGVTRSLQLEITSDPSTPGRPWGIDLIHLPYRLRRFTT